MDRRRRGVYRLLLVLGAWQPGAFAKPVTFDANFHETRGEVTRLVWFATNDPTQPQIEVRITADVKQ